MGHVAVGLVMKGQGWVGYVEVGRVIHFFPIYIQLFTNDSNLRKI